MIAEIERGSYVFAGYRVTQPVARPDYVSSELMPSKIVTGSPCIAHFVPDAWALAWTRPTEAELDAAARALGLASEQIATITKHVTAAFDREQIGWPNVVTSADALEALATLLPRSRPWIVLTLGLHRCHLDEFLSTHTPRPGEGTPAVYELIAERRALPAGGRCLGFELLGHDVGGQPHSWLCNGLEVECQRKLGIVPNSQGFLANEQDAERAAAHVSGDEVGAEPVLWLPWLLIEDRLPLEP